MKPLSKTTPLPDERLELLFRHAGLSEKQAKLYRLLLTGGEERASTLSRRSGIKRGNTYALLEDMARRGLAVKFERGKVAYFRPEPPIKLLDIISSREKEVNLAHTLADDLVPGLTSQWKTSINKPVVRHVEGQDGLKEIFEDIYSPGKSEILGCVGLEEPNKEMYDHIIKHLMPLRIKRNIWTRALVTDSDRSRTLIKNGKARLAEEFLADPKKYPMPAEIDVYEGKIAMLSFARDDFVGLVVENNAFTTTLTSVFRLLFDLLRQKNGHPDHDEAPTSTAVPESTA